MIKDSVQVRFFLIVSLFILKYNSPFTELMPKPSLFFYSLSLNLCVA
jgi:hypothetical protein